MVRICVVISLKLLCSVLPCTLMQVASGRGHTRVYGYNGEVPISMRTHKEHLIHAKHALQSDQVYMELNFILLLVTFLFSCELQVNSVLYVVLMQFV